MTWELAAMNMIPGGTRKNLQFVKDVMDWDENVPELAKIILADAQTSGGLLITLPEKEADKFIEQCLIAGISDTVAIGSIIKGEKIRVR
jgi:selenide,water dikinase